MLHFRSGTHPHKIRVRVHPHANLWLNVGHGALGFTLALATGRIVSDLAAGRRPAVPLEGFTLH